MICERSLAATALASVLAVGIASASAAGVGSGGPPGDDARRAVAGLAIAPVPLDLEGRDQGLVGFGAYLVNLATCSGCHTSPEYAPGGDPSKGEPPRVNAAGYLAGGTDFGGGVVSADLRPDAEGRPAGLGYPEFVEAMRAGRSPHAPGRPLRAMPWPAYAHLADGELAAIYAYLGAVPGVARAVGTRAGATP